MGRRAAGEVEWTYWVLVSGRELVAVSRVDIRSVHVRSLPPLRWMIWLGILLCPLVCVGEDAGLTKDLHPWGRFEHHKGAWKRYRVTTESLDENGQVVNTTVTETKTSLEDVDAEGVTLRVETIAEIAGKQLPSQPKQLRQSLRGDWAVGKAVVHGGGLAQVMIEGRAVPCRVEVAEVVGPAGKTVTRTFYSRFVSPYVLRRESRTTDPEGKTTLDETVFRVVSLDRPCKVAPHIRRAVSIESVSTTPSGSTITRGFISDEVPGGVVFHTADELDKNGRLVRHSSLVLVDFGLEPEKEDSGFIGRKRQRGRKYRTNLP